MYYYLLHRKKVARWVGFKKSYVINWGGSCKILRLLTRWVGGSKKGLKHAYVIFEWSLTYFTNVKNWNTDLQFWKIIADFDF
jgi:hypothetical protein